MPLLDLAMRAKLGFGGVLVMFQWCFGGVPVVSRLCFVVMLWLYPGGVPVVFGVLVVSWWCPGLVVWCPAGFQL